MSINTYKPLIVCLLTLFGLNSCHEEPNLPNSLIPYSCRVAKVELIDTTSRVVYTYEYDQSGNRTKSNDHRGERTFTFDGAGEYVLSQQVGGVPLTYQYDGTGTSRRISRIAGGSVSYDYIYEGGSLKTYIVKENNVTTTHAYSGGKLSGVTVSTGETVTVQNGKITRRDDGKGNVSNFTYNSNNQLTQVETITTSERRVIAYSYDTKFTYQNSGLLLRGFPGSGAEGQPGPGLDEPGGPVPINNYQTINTKVYRPASATAPVSDRTLRFNHDYYRNSYSLGYGRSDGARARYTYTNCD